MRLTVGSERNARFERAEAKLGRLAVHPEQFRLNFLFGILRFISLSPSSSLVQGSKVWSQAVTIGT